MILNLTQHPATPDQVAAGVVDAPERFKEKLTALLTFNEAPSHRELLRRAHELTCLAVEVHAALTGGSPDMLEGEYHGVEVMIGGAPYLMRHLEECLEYWGLCPIYSFSKRVSVETQHPDGTVTKSNVFKHVDFVRGSK